MRTKKPVFISRPVMQRSWIPPAQGIPLPDISSPPWPVATVPDRPCRRLPERPPLQFPDRVRRFPFPQEMKFWKAEKSPSFHCEKRDFFLYKAIQLCIVFIADVGQFSGNFRWFHLQRLAKIIQRGVKIPQLGVDKTEENHRVTGYGHIRHFFHSIKIRRRLAQQPHHTLFLSKSQWATASALSLEGECPRIFR